MDARRVLVGLAVLFLTACGSQSAAPKIASFAKADKRADSATCAKVGIMLFIGQREDVYDCRVKRVPPEFRPVTQLASPNIDACYVYTGGKVYDVTGQLGELQKAGAETHGFACVS